MKIEYLEEFVTLADMQFYHTAAGKLFISQSALSKHIQALEASMHVQLFERGASGAVLTKYGQEFLPYARSIVNQYKEGSDKINQEVTGFSTSVAVVSEFDIFPDVLEFCASNPKYRMTFEEKIAASAVYHDLKQNHCDLAVLLSGETEYSEFNSYPYLSDRFVAIVPRTHRLAEQQMIALSDLSEDRFLLPTRDTVEYHIITKACQKAGYEPRSAGNGFTFQQRVLMTARGLCVSIVPKYITFHMHDGMYTRETLDSISVLELSADIPIHANICFRKTDILRPGASAFLEFIRQKNRKPTP
ncbi:MAG: LysR family transcriptional regulator [Clostridiales bacterium]|nr:LysR family transcriptional regulator [Clostridiales bacterium]